VIVLLIRALSYGQSVQGSVQQVNEFIPYAVALEVRTRELEDAADRFGDVEVESIGEIRFDHVSHEYSGESRGLSEVSFSIRPGEIIGLVGPSGSGKSTLIQLLLRLRLPKTGTITVSGVDHREIDPACWTRRVAFVPQECSMMEGTIDENIVFMRDGISDVDVRLALEQAHILDELATQGRGLDHRLSARGTGLSGGQMQRLSIARALAGHPEVLILDEPTSSLDSRSEELICRTLDEFRGRMTVIVATHRASTLTVCDRVLRVGDGTVVEESVEDVTLADLAIEEADG